MIRNALPRKVRTALKKRVVFYREGIDHQEYVRYRVMRYVYYRLFVEPRQKGWVYEPLEFEYLFRYLRGDDVFLDIGASKGYYALVASEVCRKVYAFEPDEAMLAILRRTIEYQDIRNIQTYNFGLFSRNQRAHLKLIHGKVILRSSQDFSIKQGDLDAIDASDSAFQEIELRAFDEVRSVIGVERVDFIKIDIEGAELHAIMGMRNTLIEHKPRILLSVHPSKMKAFGHHHFDLLSVLSDLGYRQDMISGPKRLMSDRNAMANYTMFVS